MTSAERKFKDKLRGETAFFGCWPLRASSHRAYHPSYNLDRKLWVSDCHRPEAQHSLVKHRSILRCYVCYLRIRSRISLTSRELLGDFRRRPSRQCTWLTDPASTYALLHPRDGSAPEICKALTQGRRCGVHLAQQRPPLTRRKPGKAQPGPSAAKQSEPPLPGHSHEALLLDSMFCARNYRCRRGGGSERKKQRPRETCC